jgi:hypothetical protein
MMLNPDATLESPEQALDRIAPSLVAQSDVRVLLFHGQKADAEALARRYPDFRLVVYAHELDHPHEEVAVGEAQLGFNGPDGKHLGVATLSGSAGWKAQSVRYVDLEPELGEDRKALDIKAVYLDRVSSEDLLFKFPRAALASGDGFVGSEACFPCHEQAAKVWKGSAHAKAFATLEKERHEKDPECVICHVVGMDKIGGYDGRPGTKRLVDVGCESCHGPGKRHTADPSIKMGPAGEASCLTCHVPEHSPTFDFRTYWERIRH